jgi:hypothetical protein
MKISIKFPSGKKVEGVIKKNAVTVGRSHRADLVIPDESISRIHCLLEVTNGQFYVTDFDSANGVFINGDRITPQRKTPFSNFMQLSIGPMECFVQEEEEKRLSLMTSSKIQIGPPQPRRSVPKMAPRPEKPIYKRTAKQQKRIEDAKIITAFILAFVGFIYFTRSPRKLVRKTSAPQVKPLDKNAPDPFKSHVPNDFSSNNMYQLYQSKKNCIKMSEVCNEFRIIDDNEGIVIDGPEVYIYFKPSKLFIQRQLMTLAEKEGIEEVVSHYMVLGSKLMEQVDNGELDQIHLIMLNKDNRPTKVFRYHTSNFQSKDIDRFEIVENISQAIKSQDIEDIYQLLNSKIPSKDIPQS